MKDSKAYRYKLLIVALCAVSLAACNKDKGEKNDNAAPAPQTSASAAPVATQPAPAAPTQTPAKTAAPQPTASSTTPVLAKGVANNHPEVVLEITELKRTGNKMLTLRARLVNGSSERKDVSLYGIGLIDYESGNRYKSVYVPNTVCLCSGQFLYSGANQTTAGWIRFPEPPPTVKTLTIQAEGFEIIENVPISE